MAMTSDEAFEYLVKGIANSKPISHYLGIHINLRDIPEVEMYHEYYTRAPRLLKLFRRIFRKNKIEHLSTNMQQAIINRVLDKAKVAG